MVITVLVAALVVAVGEMAVIIYLERRIQRFESGLRSFFNPPDEKTPSEFAQLTDMIADRFAMKVSESVKMTLLGLKSGISRSIQAEAQDQLEEKITEENPMAGAAASLLGRRSRSKWLPVLSFLAQGMGKGQNSIRRNNGESGDKVKFDFKV